MKKIAVVLMAALILVSCGAVYAAGGTGSETLISLSYLNNTYMPDAVKQAGERVDAKTAQTYQTALDTLDAKQKAYLGGSGGGDTAAALLDRRVKRGDAITLTTGSGAVLLAGSALVSYSGGAVVDVTAGQVLASGSAMAVNRRCLAAEQTTAVITITSDTAVISLEGAPVVNPSAETDYNALADALKAMGMFKGTGTGYGSGYDLEKVPTRIEGLIMFLRMVGEEQAALAYTGSTAFVDVPDWCTRYVAYAYDKGYTKGVGPNDKGQPCFGTSRTIGAGEYVTFILRALGYADSGESPDFAWDTALARAGQLGVLTAGEGTMLSGKTFTRAQVAYLSFFTLTASMKDGGGTLLDHLSALGALDGAAVRAVMGSVPVARI